MGDRAQHRPEYKVRLLRLFDISYVLGFAQSKRFRHFIVAFSTQRRRSFVPCFVQNLFQTEDNPFDRLQIISHRTFNFRLFVFVFLNPSTTTLN